VANLFAGDVVTL